MKHVRPEREPLLIARRDVDDEGMLREKFTRRRQSLRSTNKIEIDCYSRWELAEIMNFDFDVARCMIIAIKAAPAGLPTCDNIAGRADFFRRNTNGTCRRELLVAEARITFAGPIGKRPKYSASVEMQLNTKRYTPALNLTFKARPALRPRSGK